MRKKFGRGSLIHLFNSSEKSIKTDYLLLDTFYIPYVRGLGLSKLARRNGGFHVYKWEKNKGYGTHEHQEAIKKYGITKHHREVFVKTFLAKLA